MKRRPLPAMIALSVIVAVYASACADHEAGSPAPPTTSSKSTTSQPTATSSSRLLPPRPRDIDLTGLDACKALTKTQEEQLDYDLGWQRSPVRGVDPASGEPNCTYSSSKRGFGSLIAFVTSDDAEIWLTEHMSKLPPQRTTVSGFPALQITVPSNAPLPNQCNVVVDVHDGQYLDVFSSKPVGGTVNGSAPYCDEAKKVAAMVLENQQIH